MTTKTKPLSRTMLEALLAADAHGGRMSIHTVNVFARRGIARRTAYALISRGLMAPWSNVEVDLTPEGRTVARARLDEKVYACLDTTTCLDAETVRYRLTAAETMWVRHDVVYASLVRLVEAGRAVENKDHGLGPTYARLDPTDPTDPTDPKRPARLVGHEAVEYAEAHGVSVEKHADPVEGPRTVTPDEARDIAKEDPSLLFVDTETGHAEHGVEFLVAWLPTAVAGPCRTDWTRNRPNDPAALDSFFHEVRRVVTVSGAPVQIHRETATVTPAGGIVWDWPHDDRLPGSVVSPTVHDTWHALRREDTPDPDGTLARLALRASEEWADVWPALDRPEDVVHVVQSFTPKHEQAAIATGAAWRFVRECANAIDKTWMADVGPQQFGAALRGYERAWCDAPQSNKAYVIRGAMKFVYNHWNMAKNRNTSPNEAKVLSNYADDLPAFLPTRFGKDTLHRAISAALRTLVSGHRPHKRLARLVRTMGTAAQAEQIAIPRATSATILRGVTGSDILERIERAAR